MGSKSDNLQKLMRIKKFSSSEPVDSINNFISSHIIVKDQMNPDGSYFVFFKDFNELGRADIDDIEEIDRAYVMAQTDLAKARLSLLEQKIKMKQIETAIAATHPNYKKEWDKVSQNEKKSYPEIF